MGRSRQFIRKICICATTTSSHGWSAGDISTYKKIAPPNIFRNCLCYLSKLSWLSLKKFFMFFYVLLSFSVHFAVIFGYSICSDVIPPLMDLQPCDPVFLCCFQRLENRSSLVLFWATWNRRFWQRGTPEAKSIGIDSLFFSRKGSHHILVLAKPPEGVAHTSHRPIRGILQASQNLSWNRLQEEIALCPVAAM